MTSLGDHVKFISRFSFPSSPSLKGATN